MMRASAHSPVNNISSQESQGSRPLGLENIKDLKIISSPDRRKDLPLSPLSINAMDERRLIYGIRDMNIQPTNSKDDRDSSTNAMCVSGEKTPHIENQDPVFTVENDKRRVVVWSNAIYCRESSIHDVNSVKEGKEDDVESGTHKVSNPAATNHASKGQEKRDDINSSKENENSDIESTASTWYTPLAAQGPTSETKRGALIGCTEVKDLQCSNKALFCMEDPASQNVVDATKNDSAIKHKDIGGKDKTLVKSDCIDLGIEEIEKEISRLTQKLAQLKLQKACETPSQLVDIQHKSSDKNIPMKLENEVETRNSPRERSSEKKKAGRIVSAKFRQCNLKTQPRFEKKIAETTIKSNSSRTSPQIQKKSGSSGPQLRRICSKVGCVKEDKFEWQKDKVDRQLNPKKIDVSKDAIGDVHSSERFDCKENICPCLSPVEKNLSFCPNSMSKEVAKDEKKPGKGLPENFKKLCEISENKKFQKVASNGTVGNCSKVSPAKKHDRIVASRYAQFTTPNRNATSPQVSAKLSSQRNVHGKRISIDMEVEDAKGRLNNRSAKRPAVGGFVGSPCVKDFTLRNGYQGRVVGLPLKSGTPQNSPIPCSITRQVSATVSETKKTPSPCLKYGKTTSNLTARRHGTRANNQQPFRVTWKEPSKRTNAITAEGSINKAFDPSTGNCLWGSVSSMKQRKVFVQSESHSCSAVFQPCDCLEPERMKLPKISTFRFTAKSPRDSGCLKRVLHQTGKHPFSSSDRIRKYKVD